MGPAWWCRAEAVLLLRLTAGCTGRNIAVAFSKKQTVPGRMEREIFPGLTSS